MTDAVQPDLPEQDGLAEPELPEVDIEGARLLANEARDRLHADGFDDDQIDAWVRVYFEQEPRGHRRRPRRLHRRRAGRRPHPSS